MKRTWMLAALLGFALAPAANAATSIAFTSDAPTYLAGGSITLTVTGTADGGETDNTVFGAILFEGTKVAINSGASSQTGLPNGPWTLGALTCTTARCIAFSQVRPGGASTIGATGFTVATQVWTIGGAVTAGTTITFSWQTSPTTQRLDWFGITSSSQSAPGGLTVTVVPIPEPTTVAMIGLGLFGLAVTGRRRA